MYAGPQIYVLRNKDLAISKIGFTRETAEKHATECSRGGQWTVQKYWPVRDEDLERCEWYFLELFYDWRIPYLEARHDEKSPAQLEVVTVHPDDATLLIDLIVRSSGLLDERAPDCPSVPLPTRPSLKRRVVSMWKHLRDRNRAMHKALFGELPSHWFWDYEWWREDGANEHFMRPEAPNNSHREFLASETQRQVFSEACESYSESAEAQWAARALESSLETS